ncbi:PQ loop repeat protein [Thecamonas trahens ATCC 50062]|uniref:PQ loop repeat protein n=1 Tax=Thecamonas trahens ATCC 50062 TaxID=461836 RepID=A0A0L0DN41_THETB|nr:PQ loop repeat protein [Thecamonas trahens ATCC 50062]KNC53441.1 PQ loop repeat protein [Thecamonas trahens ATCC 50062]|eukprot:XP_013754476.1 PQ loop repeat protein [Thecamonas trahens ATCC 50062]
MTKACDVYKATSPVDYHAMLTHIPTAGIVFGLTLSILGMLSVVPQHIKLLKRKTSEGMSSHWLTLSNTQMFSSVCNITLLKFPILKGCSVIGFGACYPSLIALAQRGIWLVIFPIIFEFLLYFPPRIDAWTRRSFVVAILEVVLLLCYMVAVVTSAAVLVNHFGPCHDSVLYFANILGLVATVANIIQWMPQIYTTFSAKRVGSMSIVMVAVGAPGNFLVLFFLAFVSKESVTTWLPNLSAALQQSILLALLLTYRRREKLIAQASPYVEISEDTPLVGPSKPSVAT